MSSPFIVHGRTRHWKCRVQSFLCTAADVLSRRSEKCSSSLFSRIEWIKSIESKLYLREVELINESKTALLLIAFPIESPFLPHFDWCRMSSNLTLHLLLYWFVEPNSSFVSWCWRVTIFSSVISCWLTCTYRVPDDWSKNIPPKLIKLIAIQLDTTILFDGALC